MWPWRKEQTTATITYILDPGRKRLVLYVALIGTAFLMCAVGSAWWLAAAGKTTGSAAYLPNLFVVPSALCLLCWVWVRLSVGLLTKVRYFRKQVAVAYSRPLACASEGTGVPWRSSHRVCDPGGDFGVTQPTAIARSLPTLARVKHWFYWLYVVPRDGIEPPTP
jgi:hypothetical protein